MKSSLLTLRRSPAKILNAIEARQDVTLTRRGRPIARIVPYCEGAAHDLREQPAFGMWADAAAQAGPQGRRFNGLRV
ncbi:MAG: type II toxin-antitoxin system Phd/YefM family antitoxin [Opitutales bacterium]